MTGLAELFIGTMHGYARDLLQTYVPLTFKRNVLSDIQTRLFIDRHSRASGLTVTDAVVNGVPKKLKRFVNSPLWMQVLASCARTTWMKRCCRRQLIGQGRVPEAACGEELLRLHRTVAGRGRPARRGCRRRDRRAARPARRDHVRYVVVDEYQDTNPIQEQLIERLCRFGANLCVVGDDDQTIYHGAAARWPTSCRSSTKAGVQTVTLDENFRSSRDRRARPGRGRAK